MSDSLGAWLALREAADFASRSAALTRAIADRLPRGQVTRILDLGTGTGSNIRYLADRVPSPQRWLVADRDPAVLEELSSRMASWAASRGQACAFDAGGISLRGGSFECHIETKRLELGLLDDPSLFAGRHLVTASALLDLVSERWLRSLAARCREAGAMALFALTYNGVSRCLPVEPEDDAIRELMNRHQRGNDKGFGVAAGPDGAECAVRCFADVGYTVRREPSDWVLLPHERELQRQLIEGWAEAALEIAPGEREVIRSWLDRRLAHIANDRSQIVVGHEDVGAFA